MAASIEVNNVTTLNIFYLFLLVWKENIHKESYMGAREYVKSGEDLPYL